jgi:hypothetical protein
MANLAHAGPRRELARLSTPATRGSFAPATSGTRSPTWQTSASMPAARTLPMTPKASRSTSRSEPLSFAC